ncbi:MAG: GNAT family N-acetyltransferase [Candidatus Latescibacterota bacterium]|nr:GNAT family N-acetyltransferase [Candidatus Latescibacterota bacterium]
MSALVSPSAAYQKSFIVGAREFDEEGKLNSTYLVGLGFSIKSIKVNFEDFVNALKRLSDSAFLPDGWYIDQVFWLTENDEYIGQVSVRPELTTPYLLTYGGHIGYSIRPSKRRCGYGKIILSLALKIAQKNKLKRVLVTCDSDNIGSRKIIEYNGGCYESAIRMTQSSFRTEGRLAAQNIEKLRYWIDIEDPSKDTKNTLTDNLNI